MITFEIYGVGFELSLGEIDKSKFEYWGTPFLDHLNFKLLVGIKRDYMLNRITMIFSHDKP